MRFGSADACFTLRLLLETYFFPSRKLSCWLPCGPQSEFLLAGSAPSPRRGLRAHFVSHSFLSFLPSPRHRRSLEGSTVASLLFRSLRSHDLSPTPLAQEDIESTSILFRSLRRDVLSRARAFDGSSPLSDEKHCRTLQSRARAELRSVTTTDQDTTKPPAEATQRQRREGVRFAHTMPDRVLRVNVGLIGDRASSVPND